MSFDYDPEVPAGFQEADFEMAALEEKAARSRALAREGICAHGWWQGKGNVNMTRGGLAQWRANANVRFPDREIDPAFIDTDSMPAGRAVCLHCGQLVPDPDPQR